MNITERIAVLEQHKDSLEGTERAISTARHTVSSQIELLKRQHLKDITSGNPLVRLARGDGHSPLSSNTVVRYLDAQVKARKHVKQLLNEDTEPTYSYPDEFIERYGSHGWGNYWVAYVTPIPLCDYPEDFPFEKAQHACEDVANHNTLEGWSAPYQFYYSTDALLMYDIPQPQDGQMVEIRWRIVEPDGEHE